MAGVATAKKRHSAPQVERSTARSRKRGSGGVFAVRDGVWRVDVEVGRDPVTGRRRRVSRTIRGTREEAEVDSIGGLVAHVAGRVPRVGEAVAIGEFDVVVLAGDRQRVTTVEIRRRQPPQTPEPSAAA